MDKYPKAIGPYSAYRVCGNFVFISGQLPIETQNNEIVQGISLQTKKSLENIGAILNELGLDFKDIIKTTVLLKDINDFYKMNEIYLSFFEEPYPSRSSFAVKDLPKDALVEIEAIAYRNLR